MDLPEYLLEEVFAYLGWSDRARAARVCRKWLSVFQAPSLWRCVVFKPPSRTLNRVQYDMKGYYMSCCLRKIGWHVREYRFVESEDIFLLNRTLSLIAKFLEANPPLQPPAEGPPQERHRSIVLGDSLDDEPPQSPGPSGSSDSADESSPDEEQSSGGCLDDDVGDVEDAPDANEQRMASYLGIVSGDPEAEATLKLILKLQEREMYGLSSQSSSSSSEPEEEFLASLRNRCAAMSVSVPHSAWPPQPSRTAQSKSSRLQRSQSCRYPRYQHVTRRPPMVRTFILDFHCEVDESRGFVYGTGGALLTTIRRVLRQLIHLRRLRLTDLFLTVSDARNLLIDLSKACSSTLLSLNLVHLYKPTADFADVIPPSSSVIVHRQRVGTDEAAASVYEDWYLLDSRWLGARPRRLHHNPMADLASLFPCLIRLSLGITQLTGPMLLRLLYQTNLSELCLVQTDFSPFTLNTVSGSVARPHHAVMGDDDLDHPSGPDGMHPQDEPDDELIDWGEDVPRYRERVDPTGSAVSVGHGWEPIPSKMWTAALHLRPRLNVHLRCVFTRDRFDSLARMDQLLTLWPLSPVPVRSFALRTTHGILFTHAYLTLYNPVTVTTYSSTLVTLVISIDSDQEAENVNPKDDGTAGDALNDCLLDIITLCPRLSLVAFGGSCPFLSLLTLLTMCRQRARRLSLEEERASPNQFTLLIQRDCCRFVDPGPSRVPATVQAWYSTVLEAGRDPLKRSIAAEHCISGALYQPRWHFLSAGEFESHVAEFFS